MVGLTFCFAVQEVVVVHLGKPYHVYFALSGYGMKSGHLWELFTYQFVHRGVVHFVVTLAGLWFLGRAVEGRLGHGRFIRLYLGAGVAGGLVQGLVAMTGFLLPESLDPAGPFLLNRFSSPAAGASVGLCAVWTVFCLGEPEKRIRAPGLGSVKASLLWRCTVGAAILLAILFVVLASDPDSEDCALPHLAHLTSLLSGLLLVRRRT